MARADAVSIGEAASGFARATNAGEMQAASGAEVAAGEIEHRTGGEPVPVAQGVERHNGLQKRFAARSGCRRSGRAW
jgi:hypothetical protein